jgi:hypothetical protein
MTYEFRSRIVVNNVDSWTQPDKIQQACNEWAQDGWEVFSIVVPQPSNYLTYRLTAKKPIPSAPKTGRHFR